MLSARTSAKQSYVESDLLLLLLDIIIEHIEQVKELSLKQFSEFFSVPS